MPQQNTEKRVKLGVDIGALSTDLVVLNELVKKNAELAKQGQQEYNRILNNSLQLLDTKIEKLQTINGVLQNIIDKGDINVNIKEQVETQLAQNKNLQNQKLSNLDFSELTNKGTEIVDSINEIKDFIQSIIDSVIQTQQNKEEKIQVDASELIDRPTEQASDKKVDLSTLEDLVSTLVTLAIDIKEKNYFPEDKLIGALKEIKDKNIRQRNYYPEDKILRILDDLKEKKQIGSNQNQISQNELFNEDKLIEVLSQLSQSLPKLQEDKEDQNKLLQISGLSEGFDLLASTINNLYNLVELEVDEQILVVQQVLDRLNQKEDTKAGQEKINIDLSELISSNQSIITEIQATKESIVGELNNQQNENNVDYSNELSIISQKGGGGGLRENLADAAAMVGEFILDSSENIIDILENYGDNIIQELQQIQGGGSGVLPVVNDTGANGSGENEDFSEEEKQQNRRGGRGQQAASVFNQTAGNLMKKSDIYAIAAFASMIPYVGQGLSTIISGVLEAAEDLQKGRAEYIGKTGGYGPNFGGQSGLGLSSAETYRKEAQYFPANVRLSISDLRFEKGWGINSGTMTSLLSSMREDVAQREGGLSSSQIGLRYLRDLSGGVDKSRTREIRGYGEEYLKILVQLNQEQLQTTGKTNALLTGQIVEGIMKLSDKFANPQVLQSIIGNIKAGLSQASTPQIEAMQYYTLQEMFPEASLWELEKMREDPFGFLSGNEKKDKKGRTYFENFLDNLLQTGGNLEDAKWTIRDAFNLTAHQVDQLVEGYTKGQNVKQTAQELGLLNQLDKSGKTNFVDLPVGSVSELEQHRASYQDVKAEIGEAILPAVYAMEDMVKDVVEYMKHAASVFQDEGFLKGTLILGAEAAVGAFDAAADALGRLTNKAKELAGIETNDSIVKERKNAMGASLNQGIYDSSAAQNYGIGTYSEGDGGSMMHDLYVKENNTNVPNNPNRDKPEYSSDVRDMINAGN